MSIIDFFTAIKRRRGFALGVERTSKDSREWVQPKAKGWDDASERDYLYKVIETWQNDMIQMELDNDQQGIEEAEFWIGWAQRRIRYLDTLEN